MCISQRNLSLQNACIFHLDRSTLLRMYFFIYLFLFLAGAGLDAGAKPLDETKRAPVPGSSTGHPAQFLSNVGPVPQASCSEQVVQTGVNHPWQQTPGVPLPPPTEAGTLLT